MRRVCGVGALLLSAVLGGACLFALGGRPGFRLEVVRPALGALVSDAPPRGDAPPGKEEAALLARINADRAAARLPPVVWDSRAAAAAMLYVRAQLAEGVYGHFLRDGVPPYARLSWSGVLGFCSENTSAYSADGDSLPLTNLALALDADGRMMREVPPEDGHRRAILDPNASAVGAAWASRGGEFRLDEEFVTRLYDRMRVRRTRSVRAAIRVDGRGQRGEVLAFVTVSREASPRPLTARQIEARSSYAYPDPREALIRATSRLGAAGMANRRCLTLDGAGGFSFSYVFDEHGLYTFLFYFRPRRGGAPRPGGAFTALVEEVPKGPPRR